MKKLFLKSIISFLYGISSLSQNNENFISLFNGQDLTNWTLEKEGGFEVIDGELITRSFGGGNDIFSNKSYANFVLRLEYLLSEVGNSGVYIRCESLEPSTGFEVQLLAPWTPWRDDLHCTGSIYGHVAVTNRPDETTGVWYRMEIRCDRNIVTVSVNDKVTTIADIDTVKSMEGKPYYGFVGLQGNHADAQKQFEKFRNIYIWDLDSDPDYVLKGFSSKNKQLRQLALIAAVNLGAKMIQPLTVVMSGDDMVAKNGARQALFDIVAKASDPEGPVKEKKKTRSALKKAIKSNSSGITVNYLEWILGLLNN